MIKNRTVQLIYQTVYCTLGIVGVIASLGVFDNINMIRYDCYVHFTNISNFLCTGVMFVELYRTARKKDDSPVDVSVFLKFISMLGIIMTFLVFNILLARAAGRDPQLNWRVGSICFHIVLPIMYVADCFLFYTRGKMKWFYPFSAVLFPLVYIVFLMIQAVILKFDTSILIPGTDTPLIYPYFFVNLEKQGISGVAKWLMLMFIAFVVIGFVLYIFDKISSEAFFLKKVR